MAQSEVRVPAPAATGGGILAIAGAGLFLAAGVFALTLPAEYKAKYVGWMMAALGAFGLWSAFETRRRVAKFAPEFVFRVESVSLYDRHAIESYEVRYDALTEVKLHQQTLGPGAGTLALLLRWKDGTKERLLLVAEGNLDPNAFDQLVEEFRQRPVPFADALPA